MAQQPFTAAWMVVLTSALIVLALVLSYGGVSFMLKRRGRKRDRAGRDAERRPRDRRELS